MSVYTRTHVLIDPTTEILVGKSGGWYELVLQQDGIHHTVAVSMGSAADLDRVIARLIQLRMEHAGIGAELTERMPLDPFPSEAGGR